MPARKHITIKDIARQLGVAPSTVSSVLNGKAREMRISAQLAAHITKVAAETGYHPNHTAVSLRTGKSRVLGLIVEDISNVFFATLARIIEDEADAVGYKMLYCSTENNESKAMARVRMLVHHQVAGFLLTPTAGMQQEVARLAEQQQPVVLMDRYFPGLPVAHVLVDNYAGVRMGTEYLQQKDYRNIGFVTVQLNQVQMLERKNAYLHCLAARQQTPLVLEVLYESRQEMIAQIVQFLVQHPQLDAVFFATNYLGVAGLEAIRQLGLSIPGRLAVLCFDDHDIFRLYDPPVTIIQQPVEQIARQAVQLLMRQMEEGYNAAAPAQVQLAPDLIIRSSA